MPFEPAHKRNARPWLILTTMGLIVLAPLVVSWYLTSGLSAWRPTHLSNHGLFITPVKLTTLAALHDDKGNALEEATLGGKWTLLVRHQGDCDQACRLMYATLRNAQYALGKNILRIQALALLPDSINTQAIATELRSMQPPTRIYTAPDDVYPQIVGKLQCTDGTSPPQELSLYVVDPAGRLMLCFPPAVPFADLVKDLKKLLAASSNG